MNCDSCVEGLKKIKYSLKKCGICSKRCLFRVKKMVKCNVCKIVYHKRCLAAAAETNTDEMIAAESRATTASKSTEITRTAAGPVAGHADTPVEELATAMSPAATAIEQTEETTQSAAGPVTDTPVEELAAAGNIADNHGQRPTTVVWPMVVSGAPRRALTRNHGSPASGLHRFHVLMDVVARVFGPAPAVHALLWSGHNTSSHRLSRQVAVIRSSVPPALALPTAHQTIAVLGQTSHTNETDKKVYSKAFLAQLENEPVCQNKPDALSSWVKITRTPLQQPTRYTNKRTIRQCKPNTIHISLSLRKQVQLNKTDNAWVPTVARKDKNKNEDQLRTEYIDKNVRSILNKITPDSMVPLTEKFKALPIHTFDQLEKTIDLVYEKAIEEQCFAPIYASLCSAMQSIQVSSNDSKTMVSFKKILIRKCRYRFELDMAQEQNDTELRKRAVGNCRFIGELFNIKILTPYAIHYCCENLVIRHSEAPLECLCTIMKTTGKELEQSYDLGDIFDKLKALTDKNTKYKIPTRIKFMIQDIIELRRNKWITK